VTLLKKVNIMIIKELSPRKKQILPPQITLRLMQPIPFGRIHEEFSHRNSPKSVFALSLWKITGRNRRLSAYHGRRIPQAGKI
jgi:hypothetical protein